MCRYPIDAQRVAARSGAFASQAVEWQRPTPLQRAARRRTQACLGQRLGSELRQKGMAQRYLAGGIERAACFPLRRRSRAPRRAGLQANHTAPVEWLLVEWPEGEAAPTKYWLSTLPEDTPLATLVDYAKLRWRIERDYEELKGELGLSHYEGRGWRGFHHHATLCIAAYGFLISERDAIPPSASRRRTMPRLPEGYRPRGAADPSRTPRRKLDRDDQKTPHCRAREIPRAISRRPDDLQPDCVYDAVKLGDRIAQSNAALVGTRLK